MDQQAIDDYVYVYDAMYGGGPGLLNAFDDLLNELSDETKQEVVKVMKQLSKDWRSPHAYSIAMPYVRMLRASALTVHTHHLAFAYETRN